MTERQILRDAVRVRRIDEFGGAEAAAALGTFRLQQVAFAGAHAHDFAGAGDLETLGHGLLRFDTFGTSHN